jgi:hypothetical protein
MVNSLKMTTPFLGAKPTTTSEILLPTADNSVIYFRLAGGAPAARGRGLAVQNELKR